MKEFQDGFGIPPGRPDPLRFSRDAARRRLADALIFRLRIARLQRSLLVRQEGAGN